MSLATTKLELTDVSTISIPTDAILILSLLIVFALLGYFFQKILDNQTNQCVEKVDDNLNIELLKEKLEDQLILESEIMNQEKPEKLKIKKLNFIPASRLLGIGSLAVVAIGGSTLLGIPNIQNAYKRLNIIQVNQNRENKSAKSLLLTAKIKSSNQSQIKMKKISYIDPLLSTNNRSKNNNVYQVKTRQTEDFFFF